MAGVTIPALTPAGTLGGPEPIETVQGGVSVRTTAQAIANLATATGVANPTATAGPTAVNGSASTAMRSDAAPAVQKGTSSQFGIVQPDNITITSAAGVLSAVTQSQPVTTQALSYTLIISDANSFIRMNSSTGITLTVPPHSSVAFPIGTVVAVKQVGTGAILFAAGAGVNIVSAGGVFHTNGQNAVAQIIQDATDLWTLYGNIVA